MQSLAILHTGSQRVVVLSYLGDGLRTGVSSCDHHSAEEEVRLARPVPLQRHPTVRSNSSNGPPGSISDCRDDCAVAASRAAPTLSHSAILRKRRGRNFSCTDPSLIANISMANLRVCYN